MFIPAKDTKEFIRTREYNFKTLNNIVPQFIEESKINQYGK
jgi:hypothetical protein